MFHFSTFAKVQKPSQGCKQAATGEVSTTNHTHLHQFLAFVRIREIHGSIRNPCEGGKTIARLVLIFINLHYNKNSIVFTGAISVSNCTTSDRNDGGVIMAAQSWALEQMFKVRRYQPEMVDQAVAQVLAQQTELRWAVVVGAYLDGEINLGKAAELLGMHRLELQERFIAQNIPLRIGAETLEEARAEAAAIEAWNTGAGSNE